MDLFRYPRPLSNHLFNLHLKLIPVRPVIIGALGCLPMVGSELMLAKKMIIVLFPFFNEFSGYLVDLFCIS